MERGWGSGTTGGTQKTIGEMTRTPQRLPGSTGGMNDALHGRGIRRPSTAKQSTVNTRTKTNQTTSPVRYQEPGTIPEPTRSRTISAMGRAVEGFSEQRLEKGNPPLPQGSTEVQGGDAPARVALDRAGGPSHATVLPEVQLVTNELITLRPSNFLATNLKPCGESQCDGGWTPAPGAGDNDRGASPACRRPRSGSPSMPAAPNPVEWQLFGTTRKSKRTPQYCISDQKPKTAHGSFSTFSEFKWSQSDSALWLRFDVP